MNKLSTEQLIELYKNAIKANVDKEFIRLLTKEILKRQLK